MTEEHSYLPVEGKNTGAYYGPGGIENIAAHDGVVPTVDAVIFKDVVGGICPQALFSLAERERAGGVLRLVLV